MAATSTLTPPAGQGAVARANQALSNNQPVAQKANGVNPMLLIGVVAVLLLLSGSALAYRKKTSRYLPDADQS